MKLSGMKEISRHEGKSEATILKLIREYDFPAVMVIGTWESDTVLIEKWRLDIVAGRSTLKTTGCPPLSTRKSDKIHKNCHV